MAHSAAMRSSPDLVRPDMGISSDDNLPHSPIMETSDMTAGLSLVLLGKTGAGKSASGNTILGQQAFKSKKSSRSVTRDVVLESGVFCELPVHVYDTPGFFDTEVKEQEMLLNYQNLFQRCESGPCVFLLVIKADRFTKEERKTVEKIEELLGEKRLKKTWILFTRGDELEEDNMTIKEFIDETEPLKNLVQKYDQRYHVFNNKKKGPTEQVKMLLRKILKTYIDTQVGEEMLNPLKRKIPEDIEPAAPVSSPSSMRIVLLGKTGVGKSAAGNTILGQKEFNSVMSMSSVTRVCSDAHATVSGRSVSVVDTPGLFDTQMSPDQFVTEMARSVYVSNPGPHAFLIVFPVNNRFSEHEQQIPQKIEMMFGQDVLKYSIILFTHGDQLDGESVEKLIEENCRLRDLVDQCGGRFHVFNNKDQNNREQVNDLLQKIDTMIEQNGGGHYSNEMYEDALRLRREEEEQRQREEEEQRQREEEQRKQQEEKQIQEEIERNKKEASSGFLQFLSKYKRHINMAAIAAGFVVSGAVGGAVVYGVVGGAVGGGVAGAVVGGAERGTVTGAVVGAAVGGAVGGAVGAVVSGAAAASVGAAVVKAVGVGAVGGAAVGGASSGTVKGALAGAVVGGAAVGGAAVGAALSGAVGGAAVCGAIAGGVVGGAAVGGAVSRSVAGAVHGGVAVGEAVFAGAVVGGTAVGAALSGAAVTGAVSRSVAGAVEGVMAVGEADLAGAVAGGVTSGKISVVSLAVVSLHCNTQRVRRAHFN